MPNKTIRVADLLEYANHQLASDKIADEVKGGMCSMIERVLMNSGNYRGFSYIDGWKGEPTNKIHYTVKSNLREEYDRLEQKRIDAGGMR